MLRLLALASSLLLFAAQDPADKVRALVEKLGSDEIEDRIKAETELKAMGSKALPQLRDLMAKADLDRQLRMRGMIHAIERAEAVAALLRPGPQVTLTVQDRPA